MQRTTEAKRPAPVRQRWQQAWYSTMLQAAAHDSLHGATTWHGLTAHQAQLCMVRCHHARPQKHCCDINSKNISHDPPQPSTLCKLCSHSLAVRPWRARRCCCSCCCLCKGPAISLLRRPIHTALHSVAAAAAGPHVCSVHVDLIMHGVEHSDVVAARWALRARKHHTTRRSHSEAA